MTRPAPPACQANPKDFAPLFEGVTAPALFVQPRLAARARRGWGLPALDTALARCACLALLMLAAIQPSGALGVLMNMFDFCSLTV
jgi:hypothetical protein